MPDRIVIVIPTFNERENIGTLIEDIEKVLSRNKIYGSILVVDDNSPDGTSEVVYKLSESFGNIKIMKQALR